MVINLEVITIINTKLVYSFVYFDIPAQFAYLDIISFIITRNHLK